MIDSVVDHGLWTKISQNGDESGMLCASCMADRIGIQTDWAAIRMSNAARVDPAVSAALQPDTDRQADLAKAWTLGRESCANAMRAVADNWSCGHMPPHCDCSRDIEQWRFAADECLALTPPDDLAAKIGGAE